MNWASHLLLWNNAYIKIIDVRHIKLEIGEQLVNYQFPTSTFLYTVRGTAQIKMNEYVQLVERFYLLHGGKGMRLDITAEEAFEYYMVLYKAILPLPARRELIELWGNTRLFHSQYAFKPLYPLPLYKSFDSMFQQWQQKKEWEKLQVKALMYQFIVELIRQMEIQSIEPVKPDLTAQVIHYLQEHYAESISLETMATELECSVGYLSKLFKLHMNTSPMYYLSELRIYHAKKLLIETNATLQEIAESVGYLDGYSLSRSFKRIEGVSPIQYKNNWLRTNKGEELPPYRRKNAILPSKLRRYNYSSNENHYQLEEEVNIKMYRNMKVTAMTVMLCLSLLLSACSNVQNNNGNSQTVANSGVASSQNNIPADKATDQVDTRIVSTLKGDVEIPANPQRVASDQYMGHLLKLGIMPIGVREGMLNEGWFEKAGITEDTISKIENLGAFPMNLEKLLELEPDLIIGSIEDNIEQYEKVGTTVFIPYWEGLSTADPIEKFRRISEIFGKQDVAEQWITEYEASVVKAREQIKGIVKDGETVSIVQIGSKALYVLAAEGGNYGAPTIYSMLQLPPTEQALQMTEGFELVSQEVLPEYLGDHIFVYINSQEDADEILSSAMWNSVEAVKKGNVYMYGEFGDEFVMEDPYSLEQQLDTITTLLVESNK